MEGVAIADKTSSVEKAHPTVGAEILAGWDFMSTPGTGL